MPRTQIAFVFLNNKQSYRLRWLNIQLIDTNYYLLHLNTDFYDNVNNSNNVI